MGQVTTRSAGVVVSGPSGSKRTSNRCLTAGENAERPATAKALACKCSPAFSSNCSDGSSAIRLELSSFGCVRTCVYDGLIQRGHLSKLRPCRAYRPPPQFARLPFRSKRDLLVRVHARKDVKSGLHRHLWARRGEQCCLLWP